MEFRDSLNEARLMVDRIDLLIKDLETYRNEATAKIAEYLRADDRGIQLDLDAIQATLTRPYTLIPIDEHQAWLIHWRGVRMPILGWVVAQEPAFIKAKVTRSMDLLTPLPSWVRDELGWKPPEHKAIIDGTRTSLTITEGDPETFRRKYGKHLAGPIRDGAAKIRGGDAWIRLVAALVRDGILPYQPTPVAREDWEGRQIPVLLKEIIHKKESAAGDPYIQRAVEEFFQKGAVLVNLPPGTGKTLVSCVILNHMRGRILILADTTILIDQWRDRLKLFAPDAQVTLSSYQGGARYLDQEWDLVIFDEAQRVPANTFSRLAFIKTKYRIGLTATPWREDDRQHLIVALSGFPVTIRWAELIQAGVLRRPRIIVATVPNEGAKTGYVRSLLAKHPGRALVFCDWIDQGKALADTLDVPFVHGATPRKLQVIQDSPVCVVSRVGDRGLSLPDLRLVIEVAGAGSAREQFAQRVGRLLHGDFEGTFVTVFTPEEAAKYRGRIFGVEAEMAGHVDIEFLEVGTVTPVTGKSRVVKKRSAKAPRTQGDDVIDRALAIPGVRAKIIQAQKATEDSRARGLIVKVLRYCWLAPMSVDEIMESQGQTGERTRTRLAAACRAAHQVRLMFPDESGRYKADLLEIDRLRSLAERARKG